MNAVITKRKLLDVVEELDRTEQTAKKARAGDEPANDCRPWSQPDLLARLSTFKISTWFDKPESVSAVKCALKGWVNEGLDTLHCRLCEARLIVKIRGSEPVAEKAYVKQLAESHNSACPWKERACQEDLYALPALSRKEALQDVEKRLQPLLAAPDLLPEIAEHSVVQKAQECEKEVAHSNTRAMAVAITGWSATRSPNGLLLHCSMCFRTVATWSIGERLAVLKEHRWFCPWTKEWAAFAARLRHHRGSSSAAEALAEIRSVLAI